MTNAWTRMHELNAATDEALQAVTDGLGTARFPLLLAEYHRALERANIGRMTLRVSSPMGEQYRAGLGPNTDQPSHHRPDAG